MEPGIHENVANDDYHAQAQAISNSGLSDLAQSPWHYWSRHLDPNRPAREPTQPQEDGNITHCAILEPDEFSSRYIVGPDVSRATKVWKEFAAVHADKTVIKPDQYTRAMRQRDAVWAIPDVEQALSNGRAEVSAVWNDPETGVLCRCRPDFVHEAGAGVVLIDLKTYTDGRAAEFARQCARMNYHRQDAYYSDGYHHASAQQVLAFIFLSVEMPWPHAANACMLDEDSKIAGQDQYRRLLDIYAQCLSEDHWPGYSHSIEMMRLPEWKIGERL